MARMETQTKGRNGKESTPRGEAPARGRPSEADVGMDVMKRAKYVVTGLRT